MSLKDFQPISKLGEGAYSSVYRVKRVQDSQEYGLKKVKLMNLSDKEKENALNEVRILASIQHKNIIGYKEAFIDHQSNSLCIVMDYANNGDLYQKIVEHQKKGQLIPEEKIWEIFIQIVKGLKALHEMKIFHRDLKSANVFLYTDGLVKLGDMNVSKVAKQGLLYTQTGTPYYASPEVWKDQPYDSKSDIWSLGCVLYEMTTLKPPFRAEDMEGLYKKVIKGHFPKIPSQYSQDLANIIRAMLQVQPQLRPSCERILNLSFVQQRFAESDKIVNEEENSSPALLNTIKIPKNLHYLTDKLPKPTYLKGRLDNSDEREPNKERLVLPNLVKKKNHKKKNDSISLDRPLGPTIELININRRDESVVSQRNDEDDQSIIKSIASKKQSGKYQEQKNNDPLPIPMKRKQQIKSLQGSQTDILQQDQRYILNQILQVNQLKQVENSKVQAIQRIYNVNENLSGKKNHKHKNQQRSIPQIQIDKGIHYDSNRKEEFSLPKINSSIA